MTLRTAAIIVLFVWLFADNMVIVRYRTGAAENRDRSSLKVVMIGSLTTLWAAIGLAYSPLGVMHAMPVQVAGFILLACGIALRSTAIAQLGRLHTPNVAIRADHQLKLTGLYRVVRHPSYLGALIAYLGFGLALGNWLSVLVLMVAMPCLYAYRIREEDAAMLVAFGDAYRAYCARTRRLIPWVY